MSWCILCRLLTRRYYKCLPRKISMSKKSKQFSRTNVCDRLWDINASQARCITTTKLCNQINKPIPSFNDFFTSVEDANATNEEVKLHKVIRLSDDATERDIQIKRWMFVEAVDLYVEKTETPQAAGLRRGHMEFIAQALGRMTELGVHRDLLCYKALVKVFPPDIMIPDTFWQREFFHYPKQQTKALQILEQMEENGVIPDKEIRELLSQRFGHGGHVIQRLRKMIYWMRKFQHTNPYKLPNHLPVDPIELAVLALKKMSVDLENEIKVFKVTDDDQKLFIASAQCPMQQEMIGSHPIDKPLYVEGGYKVWLREKYLTYFTLRADSDAKLFQYPTLEEEKENLDKMETIFDSEELTVRPNIHQQEDGTVLGMCITETNTKESLISWIRCLQDANPKLTTIPIVFTLRSPEEDMLKIDGQETKNDDIVPAS